MVDLSCAGFRSRQSDSQRKAPPPSTPRLKFPACTPVSTLAPRPYVTGGKLKLVAVASKKRVPAFPNAPTINETVLQGFDATSWGGLVAPAGTAPEIVKQLNAALVKVLAMPEVKEKLGTLGAEVAASKPEEFAAYIKSETDKWGAVAKAANVVAE
nr:tripartite tricarboxylate transporter substrate-binding protein [Cupriavidus sp. amp6]